MRLVFKNYQESYKKQAKVAFTALMLELPNLVLTIISGLTSNTLVVWSDVFQSLQNTIHCLVVFMIASMLRKDFGDRYNFGSDRLESFISFLCDLLVLCGFLGVIGVGVSGIINPSQPNERLGLFIILKAFNIFFDIYLLISQIKAMKDRKTQMAETELLTYKQNLIGDSVVCVIVVLCYFLRDYQWSWYISPIASICLGIYFIIVISKKIKEVVHELSDASIPVESQDNLMDIVLNHNKGIDKIHSIDCHVLNHKIYIDIDLAFKNEVTYQDELDILQEIEKDIKIKYPDSITRIIIKTKEDNNHPQN